MNYSRPCFKCRSKIIIILNYNFIHLGNQYDVGSLVSVNAQFMDIAMVNFNITCEECDYISVQKDVVPGLNSIFNCFACHKKIEFGYGSLRLEQTGSNPLESTSKYKGIIESRIDKLDDKNIADKHVLKLGQPLPLNGTCKHNKNLFQWKRFICCGRLFQCESCHNAYSKHPAQYAPTVVCGHCSKEQSSAGRKCNK
jgi:uncharacterized CHY-type Zn-finger protein